MKKSSIKRKSIQTKIGKGNYNALTGKIITFCQISVWILQVTSHAVVNS